LRSAIGGRIRPRSVADGGDRFASSIQGLRRPLFDEQRALSAEIANTLLILLTRRSEQSYEHVYH
jgi:hypothetical protein